MLLLVTFDLAEADLGAFDRYEAQVLPLLSHHGGRLEWRVRALDGRTETHLLQFPDERAFQAFCVDPHRVALAQDWERCGARSAVTAVEPIPAPTPSSEPDARPRPGTHEVP